jgi:SAM-dependent methyltransferase
MNEPKINQIVSTENFYNEDLEQMQAATNYLAWQKDLILPHICGNTLEVGAGIGSFTPTWATASDTLLALEPNQFCFEKLNKTVADQKKIRTLQIFAEHLNKNIPETPTFDTLVSTNVFEHIPDDRAVLMATIPYLRSGAKIILQVPACQWAFGEIDTRLGHYRRYDIDMIKKLFSGIDGKFLHLRYYNPIGAIGWWMNARLRKAGKQSSTQIFIFDKIILPVQSFFEKFIRFPFGQCVFVVFEYAPKK